MKKLSIIVVTLALAVAMLLPAGVCAETSSGNLLKNPSFEEYTENAKGYLKATDWIDKDDLWACVENEGSSYQPKDGKYFIWPSISGCLKSSIYQDVNISAIDAGVWIELSGWLCNYNQSPNDEAVLQLQFLDSSKKVIKTYNRSQRNPVWVKHKIQATKPASAVYARVRLIANRYVGSDNDAYFDGLSLRALGVDLNGIYISGNAKANAGTTVTLIANNGKTTDPGAYNWSSSYDLFATVDASGKVKLISGYGGYNPSVGVTIYAEEKATGESATFFFGNSVSNESPAEAVTGLKASSKAKTSITLKWSLAMNATEYTIYKKVGSKYVKVKTVAGTVNTLKVSKLKKNTSYKFKVVTSTTYGSVKYTATSKVIAVKTKK